MSRKMQKLTLPDNQNRTETGQCQKSSFPKKKGKLPKTHQDYWTSRLRKRTYIAPNGKHEVVIPTWQIRLFHAGQEGWFNLNTANQSTASVKARDIYVYLRANGWAAALTKFKPESGASPRNNLSVGDYLKAIQATGQLRIRTFMYYQNCLRTIISEAFGVKADKSRFDYRSGGNKKWVERIDAIRLERVMPTRITKWQQERLQNAGNSPVAIASAKRTANTYIRCSRSLFVPELRKGLKQVHLPAVLPFDGVELFDTGSMKYIPKVNAPAMIAAAKQELKAKEPEVYKIFLLGLFAGMRKGEIDLAEWSMVDFVNHQINLEQTEWLHLKTDDSTGQISLDPETLAELREFKAMAKSQFIIDSTVVFIVGKKQRSHVRPPRNDSARPYYRCKPVFERLNEWLRSKGVTANKPLHELRKEIGALVATEHGIYAASQFLRHSDITTTARHYAVHKTRISVGLGKLLKTDLKAA
jgi:integrase